MVGQSPLPVTPSLNILYTEDDFTVYAIDTGDGEFTIHCDVKAKVTPSLFKRIEEVFSFIVLGLIERGLDSVDTWIECDNAGQEHLANFFGFEETGFLKNVILVNGDEILMKEMRYTFPSLED